MAWRIVQSMYVASAFDGEGSRLGGGRWNSKGTSIVYTAESQALAVLELLVHLKSKDLPKQYRLIPVTFEAAQVRVLEPAMLPASWRRRPIPLATRVIGDEWAASERSVVLQVPSVVIPGENNYLLNVAHPDFSKLVIGKPQPYRFDSRLK